jgi:hypothetical protein
MSDKERQEAFSKKIFAVAEAAVCKLIGYVLKKSYNVLFKDVEPCDPITYACKGSVNKILSMYVDVGFKSDDYKSIITMDKLTNEKTISDTLDFLNYAVKVVHGTIANSLENEEDKKIVKLLDFVFNKDTCVWTTNYVPEHLRLYRQYVLMLQDTLGKTLDEETQKKHDEILSNVNVLKLVVEESKFVDDIKRENERLSELPQLYVNAKYTTKESLFAQSAMMNHSGKQSNIKGGSIFDSK